MSDQTADVDADLARRAAVHAALADPVRLGIVDEVAVSDRSPTELADRFTVRSNLLAHHLDVLAAAGLIERLVSHGDRRRRYVRLLPDALVGLVAVPVLDAAGVVFVCTRNSARSQLATAVWNTRSAVPSTSAGTDPADRVHPEAVRAARRHGLDLGDAVPVRLDPDRLDGQLVVTVCDLAHEDLTVLADRTRVVHWSIPDPADTGRPADFDAVVDTLADRVAALAAAVRAA